MLRAAVDHAPEHTDDPCCAAVMLITLHKQTESNVAIVTSAAPDIDGVYWLTNDLNLQAPRSLFI